MKYLRQAAIILLVTCIGELLHYFLPLPIPASIYGLLLMFSLLLTHVVKVGLLVSWADLQAMLGPVCVITAVVTLIVMVVTGKVSDAMLSKKPGEVKNEVLECAEEVREQAETALSAAAGMAKEV